MNHWTTIFRDAVPRVAGVTVWDKGYTDVFGRYFVAKLMKLQNGQTRLNQNYFSQRRAALRYARKFLAERAVKAGLTYTEGDGKNTMAGYQPEKTNANET